jgi:hypothetical protein
MHTSRPAVDVVFDPKKYRSLNSIFVIALRQCWRVKMWTTLLLKLFGKFIAGLVSHVINLLKVMEANPHAAKVLLLYGALGVFFYLLTIISRLP